MTAKPKTIDEYLAGLGDDNRLVLERLRKTIKAVAPKAEECISYRLPAFRLNGRMLVAFGATASRCAFYPMISSTVEAHKDELKGYDTRKGTIRFQANKPLPAALVWKLVKARIAESQDSPGAVRPSPDEGFCVVWGACAGERESDSREPASRNRCPGS
jgi:uncharacterized protein YdhG (YjbR/CyaY superfamily)